MAAWGMEIYNLLPNEAYVVLHLFGIMLGLWLASRAVAQKKPAYALLFSCFSLAELAFVLSYVGFLALQLSNVIAELLLLAGLIFVVLDAK
ncbi:MAG: hypothetical protein ABIG96_01700 [Candidatus Micrarchaeota archaeon]